MKRFILLAAVLCVALSPALGAQEGKAEIGDLPTAPPEPLDDPWTRWLVGEWEGWSESPYGKATESLVVELGLGGQFLLMQATSDLGEMKWTGMGAMTVDPETGHHKGYWIDSWRGMYEGKGKLEGNKETTEWRGSMGTAVRVVEKVSEDKFVVTEKMTMPDGSVIDARAEMTRVKRSTN